MCEISFFGWLVCCCSKLNYSYSVAAASEMAETGGSANNGEGVGEEHRDGALLEKGLEILVRLVCFALFSVSH